MSEKDEIFEEIIDISEEGIDEESSIKIAPDVVAAIAGIATSEIKGVAGMFTSFAGGIAEKFGTKKPATKGIKAEINNNSTIIDIYVIVDYGIRIPELAWEIQENVKNSVETMTGLLVEKVNIHINGVSFKKIKDEEEAQKNLEDDNDEEIIIEEAEIEEIPEGNELDVL